MFLTTKRTRAIKEGKALCHYDSDSNERNKPLKKNVQIVKELSTQEHNVSGAHNDELLTKEETSADETYLEIVDNLKLTSQSLRKFSFFSLFTDKKHVGQKNYFVNKTLLRVTETVKVDITKVQEVHCWRIIQMRDKPNEA